MANMKPGKAINEAWQKAHDAWVRAGKAVPCYEPKYMAARKVLADVYKKYGWG